MANPDYGSELRKRMSPEFARRERKRTLWAGVVGIGMGVTNLVLGANGIRTGQWVKFGRLGGEVELPGFVLILMGLFLVGCSGAIMWRVRRV